MAFFTATNNTDQPIIGVSTYNIVPYEAAAYFNKIQVNGDSNFSYFVVDVKDSSFGTFMSAPATKLIPLQVRNRAAADDEDYFDCDRFRCLVCIIHR